MPPPAPALTLTESETLPPNVFLNLPPRRGASEELYLGTHVAGTPLLSLSLAQDTTYHRASPHVPAEAGVLLAHEEDIGEEVQTKAHSGAETRGHLGIHGPRPASGWTEIGSVTTRENALVVANRMVRLGQG